MQRLKLTSESTRRCVICGQVKPIENFRNGKANHFRSNCRTCNQARQRQQYRQKAGERHNEMICDRCENLLYCKSQVRHGRPLHPNCENPEPIPTPAK